MLSKFIVLPVPWIRTWIWIRIRIQIGPKILDPDPNSMYFDPQHCWVRYLKLPKKPAARYNKTYSYVNLLQYYESTTTTTFPSTTSKLLSYPLGPLLRYLWRWALLAAPRGCATKASSSSAAAGGGGGWGVGTASDPPHQTARPAIQPRLTAPSINQPYWAPVPG